MPVLFSDKVWETNFRLNRNNFNDTIENSKSDKGVNPND